MLLIIQHLLEGDIKSLKFELAIVAIMWGLATSAMAIDLVFGWSKAKKRGEARTSYGLRRTVTKAVLYYALLFFAFMFDCIGMFFYALPYMTMIGTAFILFIEGKSIIEKAHDKDKRRLNRSLDELATLLENRGDLIKGIIEIVKRESVDGSGKEDDNSFDKME